MQISGNPPIRRCVFEYDTEDEAKKKKATIQRYRSTGKHTDYEVYRLGDKIYIEKVKTERK